MGPLAPQSADTLPAWSRWKAERMILNRLYYERRRLALTVSVSFLAGYLLYLPYEVAVFTVPLPIVTGACYAVLVGLSAAGICLLLPRLRYMVEMFALARLAVALAALLVPQLGWLLISSPLANATVMVMMAVLLDRGARSRIAARWIRCPASVRLYAAVAAPGVSAGSPDGLAEVFRNVPGGSQAVASSSHIGRSGTSGLIPLQDLPLLVWVRSWLDDAFGRQGGCLTLTRARTAARAAAVH